MSSPSKAVLIKAAKLLLDCEDDDEHFPIAEIMLRLILTERVRADTIDQLEKLKAPR